MSRNPLELGMGDLEMSKNCWKREWGFWGYPEELEIGIGVWAVSRTPGNGNGGFGDVREHPGNGNGGVGNVQESLEGGIGDFWDTQG